MSGPNMRAVIRTSRLLAELGLTSPIEALEELAQARQDAARYRMLRRGQHWSVVNGIGDTLRAEALDAAVDATLPAAPIPCAA